MPEFASYEGKCRFDGCLHDREPDCAVKEALEAGDFILAGITTEELRQATSMAIEMKQKGVLGKPCPDYVDETVSMKVVRIIQGYVGVVNKMVWRKF